MADARLDVLCCGLATLDLIQYVERAPGPDEKIVADETILDVGGPAANGARTAAVLGSTTSLVTVLGAAAVGETVSDLLREAGVEVVDACPEVLGWRPPIVAITVDTAGRRSVVSAVDRGAPIAAVAPELPGARVVLLDGHLLDLADAVARVQRDGGAVVVLDGGSWKPGLERLLPLVDVAVVSAAFACPPEHRALFDAIPYRAVTAGSAPIRVAPGPDPANGTTDAVTSHASGQGSERSAESPVADTRARTSGEELVHVPAVDVVDTLGAGDVLHGALCHQLARAPGLDHEAFLEALASAAAVASRSCAARGVLGWTHVAD